SYVPPSNIIDKRGLDQLHKGMPSIKYICSLYLGETIEGGNREFDFDPYNPEFFDYPRISDGFYLSNDKTFSHESLYIYTGIWTHFVHPDDVYQIENPYSKSAGDFDLRNMKGLGWRKTKGKDYGMFSNWNDYLDQMARTYPQMRYVNAGEGGVIVNDWRASKFRHSKSNGSYTVEEMDNSKSLSDKQYWFLYSSLENAEKIESQLKTKSAIFSKTPLLNGFLFSIYTNKSKITLKDLQHKNPEELLAMEDISKRVINDYKAFRLNVAKFNTGGYIDEWVDDSEIKFKQEIADLKTRMLTESKIDTATWNKYAKYMTWEDRGGEVWQMLDEHCEKHPDSHNLMYSKQLNKIIEYPDDIIREKWMSAQLLITPEDTELLKLYIELFSSSENQLKIRSAYKNLRRTDNSLETYLQYLENLLAYNQPGAFEELEKIKPSEEYRRLASDIAWLYANDNQFKLAYEWSEFADGIDFESKMSWMLEMKSYTLMESEYNKYIALNPNDFKVKAVMSGVLHEMGRFKDAWVIVNSMPETFEKKELRSTLNTDVLYVEADVQQDLIDNHAALFFPEVMEQLTKSARKEGAPFIEFKSTAETNKNDPSAFKNILSYNFYDKKRNLHGIAGTYSTMYKNIAISQAIEPDNITHAIGGIQYQFNNPRNYDKLQYWARARAEYSSEERFYYLFGMGANFSKKKNYKSAEFKIFPAETGPAYSKDIYRMQLNIYQDYYLLKYFNASISLEGNYYTPSRSNSGVKTSDTYEGSITTKITWDKGVDKRSKFLPFVEASQFQASIGSSTLDLAAGYPYWIIDERLYGGGGIGWKFGLPDSNLITRVEAAYFLDDYSDNFQRYVGEVAYQIFDFTLITASFEIYAQSKFFSNVVQFGVKHNLKKRKKK
ncbi:MAG: DUF2194 domain-containing protein, partial [Flavisolibacter sp.]|nr:DUF2194 domain-containing protein [Flavisolibacter sp.]